MTLNTHSPAAINPHDLQNLEQLQNAFNTFNSATETFQNYYLQLERRIEELNLELERKNHELETNLVERERMRNYLATLLESISAGVIVTDENQEIVTINRAAREIFALPETLSETATLFELIPALQHSRKLNTTLRQGVERKQRFDLECEDSGQWLDIQILPASICELNTALENTVPGNGGPYAPSTIHYPLTKGVILVIHDVTELKELARQASLNSRLQAMGEIAMNVAHEVRNPLGSIELFSSTLERALADQAELRQLAAYIQTGVRSIDAIVNNVLLFARNSESGTRQEICARKVGAAALLEEALLFLKPALEEKTIEMQRRYAAESGEILGDPDLLRQALMNLVRNSIQAMSKNGRLELEILRETDAVHYRIFDNGCGIPSKNQQNIFKPFFSSRRKGTGLGLAISQRIIQAHQGEINFASRESGGTVFTIKLPARP